MLATALAGDEDASRTTFGVGADTAQDLANVWVRGEGEEQSTPELVLLEIPSEFDNEGAERALAAANEEAVLSASVEEKASMAPPSHSA